MEHAIERWQVSGLPVSAVTQQRPAARQWRRPRRRNLTAGRIRAGMPTAMELAGRSVTTTALAPIETSFADGDGAEKPGATSAAAELAIWN
jgi:hypothetical protein